MTVFLLTLVKSASYDVGCSLVDLVGARAREAPGEVGNGDRNYRLSLDYAILGFGPGIVGCSHGPYAVTAEKICSSNAAEQQDYLRTNEGYLLP